MRWSATERQAVLDAYNGRCAACGDVDTQTLQIDHIDPQGPTRAFNGRPMCGPCNLAKSDLFAPLALTAYPAIDTTDAKQVGEAVLASWAIREEFANEMILAHSREFEGLVRWAKSQIDDGRRVASVIKTIARTHNKRTSKKVSRAL
tara:strand:+ start:359 stop:799 length:441 start_codon:yes stop_codon:yes gene_type:complete